MTVKMPERCVIKFRVRGKPESAGVRIRTTDPVGVYASCADRETAISFFQNALRELAVDRGLVDFRPGTQFDHMIDWPTIIDSPSGEGEVVIRVSTQAEIDDVRATGHQVHASSTDTAVTDRWADQYGKKFWIVRDKGDLIDSWLLDQLKADIKAEEPDAG
jgi:hypothetical protein